MAVYSIREQYNVIHDCYVEVFKTELNTKEENYIFLRLPTSIKHLAMQWGWYDTEVREQVYVWIRDNKDDIRKGALAL